MKKLAFASIAYVLMALALASSANAANNIWTNTAGGVWEDATSWSQGSVPDVTDQVKVGSNGSYTVTVGSSAANTAPNSFTNSDLFVHGYGGGSPTLLMNYTNAVTFVVTNNVQIGNGTLTFAAPNGSLQISNASLRGLIMNDTTASGTPGGTQGVLNVQAGLFDTGNRAILAHSADTRSTINITGGTLFTRNSIFVGRLGTAEINILGGDAVFGSGYVGYGPGATGRIALVSGRMWLTNGPSGTLGIGSGVGDGANRGYGELIISNGNFFSGNNTLLGIGSGTGTNGGGRGVMQVFGGIHTNQAPIRVADVLNSTGTVLLAGGRWNADDDWVLGRGSNSFGSLTISNGSYVGVRPSKGTIHVGNGNFGSAVLNMAGGELLLTNTTTATTEAYIAVGNASNAVGRLNVTGGRMAILNAGGLYIGTGNTDFGATTTNTAGTAEVLLTGGRLELRRIVAAGTGVLSNRTGGLLQFVGVDNVTGSPSRLIVDGGTLSYKNYSSLTVAVAVAKFSVVSGSGLELDSSTNVNITGTYTLTNAANNFKTLRLTGNRPKWNSDNLQITSGSTLHISNATAARVASVITNDGTIRVQNSTVTYERALTTSGRYISDSSTSTFNSNVTVTASGTLEGGAGDLFEFKKSLFIQSTNNFVFNLLSSRVLFSGGGVHTNAIMGRDLGTNGAGYANNFAYDTLSLTSATDSICFQCGDIGAVSNALYVHFLDLMNSTGLVANLHAPTNINIYYLLSEHDSRNAYLLDQTYQLTDCNGITLGGMLIPAVPEPSTLAMLAMACCAFWRSRRRRTAVE